MTKTTRPLYREIAAKLAAIRNCRESGNTEWEAKHGDALKELVDMLPSGCGIDCGTKIDEDACHAGKLVFSFSFHHMNDAGMYDGWTDHQVFVTPSFDGIDLRITGRNRNDIKEYLYETYHFALTQETEIA